MMSFCVHSRDEADALRRLLLSSLPFADVFDEWVVIDHASVDHTPAVLAELAPKLEAAGIQLRTMREDRPLSAAFTFAQLRNAALKACKNKIAVIHDADFILGPAFGAFLSRAAAKLLATRKARHYSATYTVPVIWDRLVTDANGRITDHGRVWVHQRKSRILLRDAAEYRQVGRGGMFEKDRPTTKVRRRKHHMTGTRPDVVPSTLVSVNVKAAARIEKRRTMTYFMAAAVTGRLAGTWEEHYEAGEIDVQPPYDYNDVDLRGWQIYAPNLDLAA